MLHHSSPARFFGAFVVVAFLGACAGRSVPSVPIGWSNSTAGVSVQNATPNPHITWARISVTIAGSPAPNIPVVESTPRSDKRPFPCAPIAKKRTDASGKTVFRKLLPSQIYCWVATLTPTEKSSVCATWQAWQSGTIQMGT